MGNTKIKLSSSALKFMQKNGITDVTFDLCRAEPKGFLKEIEPVYQAPADASGYRYFVVEGYHIFVARDIKILGPLTISTEGIWRFKQLFLDGAGAAVSFWIFEEN
ncbi:MAG: hypothetical protein BBJ57_06730 [Desulfobacterales bacterium PC51MH44]|nr:MAG: hypothetical protein BBJ57_06730 [Desulfobacterales bacterium PC51MH44]